MIQIDEEATSRTNFFEQHRAANAVAMGAAPPFSALVDHASWINAMNERLPVYALATAAVEDLAVTAETGGITSVRQVLVQVGRGSSFEGAFRSVYALGTDEFEVAFLERLVSGAGFPGVHLRRAASNLGERLDFVYLGFEPNERVKIQFLHGETAIQTKAGPIALSCRMGDRDDTVDSLGLLDFSVGTSPGCSGKWSVTLLGSHGSKGFFQYDPLRGISGPDPSAAKGASETTQPMFDAFLELMAPSVEVVAERARQLLDVQVSIGTLLAMASVAACLRGLSAFRRSKKGGEPAGRD